MERRDRSEEASCKILLKIVIKHNTKHTHPKRKIAQRTERVGMDVEKERKKKKRKKIHSNLKEKESAKGWDRTEVGVVNGWRGVEWELGEEGGKKEGGCAANCVDVDVCPW